MTAVQALGLAVAHVALTAGGVGLLAVLLLSGALLVTARALGERLGRELERRLSPLGAVWVGWLTFMALGFVPFLGWALMAFALVIGLGATLRGRPAPAPARDAETGAIDP